ncbi:hypothetical protein OpiT1DRAFT_04022 [Opitutaceae bacterium TAV1]|nr:hypothetical protein OpiT1DRAFT_04022 [Opitutaceae bacterium TAV1]
MTRSQPRKQVDSPLAQAPALRVLPAVHHPGPGADTGGLRSGAIAAQPIFQLANALGDIVPELLPLIREKAAREKQDALTFNDLKAAREDSQTKLNALNGALKQHLDDGTLPRSRLPYAVIGYSRRSGQDIAADKLPELYEARLADATSPDSTFDPDAVIHQVNEEIRSLLPQDNIYALQGFQQEADRQAERFRQRASAMHEQKFAEAQEARIGTRLESFADAYAYADPDEREGVATQAHQFISTIKEQEIPRHRIAPLVASKALEAVRDILSSDPTATDRAERVLSLYHDYDLTGQGGLLGKTAAARSYFIAARQAIHEADQQADTIDRKRVDQNRIDRQLGVDAGHATRAEHGDKPFTKADRDEYVKRFAESPEGRNPQKLDAYREFLDKTLSDSKASKADDNDTLATALRMVRTIDPAALDEAQDFIRQAEARGDLLGLTVAQRLEPEMMKARALSGVYDARWRSITAARLYGGTGDEDSPDSLTPAFPSVVEPGDLDLSQDEWRKHRSQVLDFFDREVREQLVILSEGDPAKAFQVREKARMEAFTATTREAERLATQMRQEKKQQAREKIQADLSARVLRGMTDHETLTQETRALLDGKPWGSALFYRLTHDIPMKDSWPPAIIDPREHWLQSLADQATASQAHATAYAFAKSAEGYTIDEMKAGKTSEGLPLNPRLIDWRTVPLFRSRKELEAAYSRRKDRDGVFNEVHLLVDPARLHPAADLYTAQATLFSK